MFKPSVDKIVYLLIGVAATTGLFGAERHLHKDNVTKIIADAIIGGEFCNEDGTEVDISSAEVEEIYFVGCGGFF
ncbi:MAG: hypothetical protein ACI92I_000443 [Acidimicrobiales bacterium]|jgi:hypothetical protein